MLEDIRALVSRDWQVRITHVWREANRCADALARLGSEGSEALKIWGTPYCKFYPCYMMMPRD